MVYLIAYIFHPFLTQSCLGKQLPECKVKFCNGHFEYPKRMSQFSANKKSDFFITYMALFFSFGRPCADSISNTPLKHSLGKSDYFPPEDESNFPYKIIEQRFAETYKNLSKFEDLVGLSPEDLQHVLNDLVKRCVEIERPIRLKLEILCMAIANDLFDIPEESILFKCSLVDRVDLTNKRKPPEKSDDVEFNHTQEMEDLNKEVYKRRLINSLIQGASLKYSSDVKNYIDDIYELNYDLPKIYEKIIAINNHLLFYNDDEETSSTVGGNCESYLGDSSKPSSVHASALIFPLL
ncbi:MAG: hypothetical protein EZS28_034895, partial [Streblomastix strix]